MSSTSLLLGIPTTAKSDPVIDKYQNQQSRKAAEKLAGLDHTSPYTKAILDHIVNECSRSGHRLTPKEFHRAILTLEALPRPNYQVEIENQIRGVGDRILCYGATDVRRDAAALWALSDLCEDFELDNIKPTNNKVMETLVCRLNCCRVPCQPVDPRTKLTLTGTADTDKQNEKNLLQAMYELGLLNPQDPAVVATHNGIAKIVGVAPVEDFKSQLLANGAKENKILASLIKTISTKNLGSQYPVDLVWPAFPFGTGTGGRLGATTPDTSSTDWTKVLQTLTLEAGKQAIDLANYYGKSKIDEVTQNYKNQMTQIMQSSGAGPNPTDDQIAAYAQQNQAQAQAALQQALAQAQIDLAKVKEEADKKNTNTLMYVGIGVGALMFLGLIAVVATKK